MDEAFTLLQAYDLKNEIEADLTAEKPALLSYCLDKALLHQDEVNIKDCLLTFQQHRYPFARTSLHGLSPLHVAVIVNRAEVCKELLELGADVNAPDKRNWTPLHHAAVGNHKEVISVLKTYGADLDLKNDTGGTYLNILTLIDSPIEEKETLIPLFYREDNAKERQLTAGEYKQITHSSYIFENIVDPSYLILNWLKEKPPLSNPDLLPLFDESWKKFLHHHPIHRLSPMTHHGHPLPHQLSLGLFARQWMSPMELIGEYLGEFQVKRPIPSLYSILNGPDAVRFSNDISRINDGFPNLGMLFFPDRGGMSRRFVLTALEEIAPGEEFCWNYASHDIKLGPYIEIRQQPLRAFLKGPFRKRIFEIVEARTKGGFQNYADFERLLYILQTPPVIFSLFLEGIIDLASLCMLGVYSKMGGYIPIQYQEIFHFISQTGVRIQNFKERFQNAYPHIWQDVLSYLQLFPARFRIDRALQASELVMRAVDARPTQENENTLKESWPYFWEKTRAELEKTFAS
jgi:hypothetical protein